MKKIFVDSNLFIRYLVNDMPEMANQVERLLDKAEKGEINLVTGPPVFFELAWTLKSFYKKSRQYIYECLQSILGVEGLEVLDAALLEQTLEIYRSSAIDFGDAYIRASAEVVKAGSIATFNRDHFKNLGIPIYNLESD